MQKVNTTDAPKGARDFALPSETPSSVVKRIGAIDAIDAVCGDLWIVWAALMSLESYNDDVKSGCIWSVSRSIDSLKAISDHLSALSEREPVRVRVNEEHAEESLLDLIGKMEAAYWRWCATGPFGEDMEIGGPLYEAYEQLESDFIDFQCGNEKEAWIKASYVADRPHINEMADKLAPILRTIAGLKSGQ